MTNIGFIGLRRMGLPMSARLAAAGYEVTAADSRPELDASARAAQRIKILYVDDIDGSAAEGTVRFGLDGVDYEIGLSKKHA